MTLLVAVPILFLNIFNNSAFKTAMESLPKGGLEIASDSAFSNKTTNFSPSQTIYVRATADNSGSESHVLNLRDSNYNLITSYQLAISGNQFTVSFSAPSNSGTYSLDANIKSGSSVVNLVQTITVGGSGGNGSANVKVNVNTNANSNNQVLGEAVVTPSPEPTATPVAIAEPPKKNFFETVWSAITGFFKGWF